MRLLIYYKENKIILTMQFENPMVIFKMVAIGIPIRIPFQLSVIKQIYGDGIAL